MRYGFTASLRPVPARKLGVKVAAILISSPVRGFRPIRAFRLFALKVPNPVTWTCFLLSSSLAITPSSVPKMASTARFASSFVNPV